MIVFAHTKFGLVRIQGGGIRPPRSERVFQIPVQIGLRIEHLCDIIPKAQSWLVLNLPVFMFVYIYFNALPTRITDLVRAGLYDQRFH